MYRSCDSTGSAILICRKQFTGFAVVLCLLPFAEQWSVAADKPNATRPNIVVIMADDLGWADLGCTGSTFYETPHIDRLAAESLRFANSYSACPVCSPTRTAAMTGKYPARVKITDYIPGTRRGRLNPAFYLHDLPLAEVTIAEALREAGYATGFVGKWHLGNRDYWPQDQGFDVNVAGSHLGGNKQISPYDMPNLSNGPDGEYLTDRLTDEAVKYIKATHERPFLLWLPHYDVHTPLVAPQGLIDKFQAKADGLPPSAEPRFRAEHDSQDRRMQDHGVYAAKVASLDASVGRIMATLAELGIAERTIVLFTSDNGGLSTAGGLPTSNAPLRAGKGWLYEGGIRVPLLIRWPGVIKGGRVCDVPVITNDIYPTLLAMTGLPARPEQHCDGVSLTPLVEEAQHCRGTHFIGTTRITVTREERQEVPFAQGDWKLIEFFEDNHVELFNLRADPGEQQDLAAEQPERANDLRGKLAAWRKSVDAEMPTPNPDFVPGQEQE